jgi:uncharacterized damage-inducible protein DinB
MATSSLPEFWLRGAIPGISPYLQPVAHALLQAGEEVTDHMKDFPDHLLWEKPAGVASPGFHLQHLSGVLDRLFTYAAGEMLSEQQLRALKAEGISGDENISTQDLLQSFQRQVEKSLETLKRYNEQTLTEPRSVGRAKLPSTVLGLLFHAAEHTMRHTGQLLVTAKVLKAQEESLPD